MLNSHQSFSHYIKLNQSEVIYTDRPNSVGDWSWAPRVSWPLSKWRCLVTNSQVPFTDRATLYWWEYHCVTVDSWRVKVRCWVLITLHVEAKMLTIFTITKTVSSVCLSGVVKVRGYSVPKLSRFQQARGLHTLLSAAKEVMKWVKLKS